MTETELAAIVAEAEARQAAYADLLCFAEQARVPWSYQMTSLVETCPGYTVWLAHEYICRRIGVDPLAPPAILGEPPARPTVSPEALERDLDALADFALIPLCQFTERLAEERGHTIRP